jgi:hypothetical protein
VLKKYSNSLITIKVLEHLYYTQPRATKTLVMPGLQAYFYILIKPYLIERYALIHWIYVGKDYRVS